MTPLTQSAIASAEAALIHNTAVYEDGKHIAAADFLKTVWEAIGSFVHHNKTNPLLQQTVKAYPDLVPRAFAILTIQFGAYTYEPKKPAILKDLARMLDEDLVEKELSVCAYAANRNGSFFPGLHGFMEDIRGIYGAEHFPLEVLPPNPYHAYALFVLNHPTLLETKLSPEALFGHLAVMHSKMTKVLGLCTGDKKAQPKQ